jgi:hypothetical protein
MITAAGIRKSANSAVAPTLDAAVVSRLASELTARDNWRRVSTSFTGNLGGQ